MSNALIAAAEQKMDCVQVFTKNQRQWNSKPLQEQEIESWLNELQKNGWDGNGTSVSHNSYLINLASPDAKARKKSMALQREEIERCETLHIPFLVSHPGARLGTPRNRTDANTLSQQPTTEEIDGLQRIVTSLDQLHQELPGYNTITCLETTVGSGTNLGYDFQHLAWIHSNVAEPERIAFCFDTCHVTAAGYDMSTMEKARNVLQQFEDIAGLEHIKVFHLNDSIGEIGSRVDRHAHIGEGKCGRSCFKAIVELPIFDLVPKILETPKEESPSGKPMDLVNISILRRMAKAAKKRR
jgi:deoxyribonuclease-4